ncbi:MAG: hypothetical protein QME63_05670 [Actinomycetota bacterium]|nr:hypothetical protein [Actinomycetota bacterium]
MRVVAICKNLMILVAVLTLLVLGGCAQAQYVNLSYSFAISPKKGEVLKDVTVYLPFPVKDGKPVIEIYSRLLKDYREYWNNNSPNLKLFPIKTRYGYMLKLFIPMIDKKGFGLEANYSFKELHSSKSAALRFQINPRLNARKLKGFETGNLCNSYIYTRFSGARELGLALTYEIKVQAPSLLPLDYIPERNYYSYLGWDRVPGNSEFLVKYYPSKGWQKIPLVDLGYRGE